MSTADSPSFENDPLRVEVLDTDQIVEGILAAQRKLFSPANRRDKDEVWWDRLPTTILTPGDTTAAIDARQIQVIRDIEIYNGALEDSRLQYYGLQPPSFVESTFISEGDEPTLVHTKTAMLDPNSVLVLSFDLDQEPYALNSGARIVMSKNRHALYRVMHRLLKPEALTAV